MVKSKIKNQKSKIDLSIKIGRIKMKNPIMVASGTFGYAKEYEDLLDVERLGAIVTKTITYRPRSGNPPPRIVETPFGMLNSIGLENDGVDAFIKDKLPYLKGKGTPVIVSIGGEKINDFTKLAKRLDGIGGIAGLEINISCPNLKNQKSILRQAQDCPERSRGTKINPSTSSGLSRAKSRDKNQKLRMFSQDRKATYQVVKKVRRATGLTIITKLTPNVTDIVEIAMAAEEAGSDAISLVNTYMGMAIDISTRRPLLGNAIGGLSGPAIKPLALKTVWDVYNSVSIPIIGIGGIMTVEDVLEFIICGSTAVALGSVNFVYPKKSVEIIDSLGYYIKSKKIKGIKKLIGCLNIYPKINPWG